MRRKETIIKLVLRESKANKQGKCPIVLWLVVNGQRMEKNTKVSVASSEWDAKKEQVKKTCHGYIALNKQLQELKNKAIERMYEFEAMGAQYTPQMLLAEQLPTQTITDDFKGILKQLSEERHLKYNTNKTYDLMFKKLSKFVGRDNFTFQDLTADIIREFFYQLRKDGIKDGSIKAIFEKLYSTWHYAIDKGFISWDISRKFKYWEMLKISNHHQAITKQQLDTLFSHWINNFTTVDVADGVVHYKDDTYNRMCYNRRSAEFGIAFFILGYYFQGLAMTDMANITIDGFKKKMVGDTECYIYRDFRTKTGANVNIIIPICDEVEVLLKPFVDTAHNREGYLFPIYQTYALGKKTARQYPTYNYKTDKDRQIALNLTSGYVNKHLKKVCETYGWEEITYYACRHTFATLYVQSEGSNIVNLATMLGRTIENISCYVKELTTDEEILKERLKITGNKSLI